MKSAVLTLALLATSMATASSNGNHPDKTQREAWDRAMACDGRGDQACAVSACNQVVGGTPWIGEFCLALVSGEKSSNRGMDRALDSFKESLGKTRIEWYPKVVAAEKLKGDDRRKAIVNALNEQVQASFAAADYLEQFNDAKAKLAALQKKAEAGDADAQDTLGSIYYDAGLPGVEKNDQLAVQWFSKAAAQGHAHAQLGMGLAYEAGRGVPKDGSQAANWYQKAADQGMPRAQFLLASLLSDGKDAPKDDEVRAFNLLRVAADGGYRDAQNSLGVRYTQGRGIQQNYGEAIAWYKKAASRGDAYAQTNLGVLAEDGLGMPKDHATAASWYEMAVKNGDARAKWRLARLLANGWGTAKDPDRAMTLFRQAASAGESPGWFYLGHMHDTGNGVPKDETKALDYYLRAAEAGDKAAMYNISLLLGKQTPKDHAKIFEWRKKSAELGDAAAQNDAGVSYHNGEGVDANYGWAIYWYAKSAQQGNTLAIDNLKKVLPHRDYSLITGNSANLRDAASTDSRVLTSLPKGTRVYPIGDPAPGWKMVYVESGFRLGYLATSVLASAPSKPTGLAAPVASPWPARPAAKPGHLTCNTNCRNGDCYRTYSSGKKVRFQAQQKWNPFTSQFEWDSGGC